MSFDASEVYHLAADLAAAPAKVEAEGVTAVGRRARELQLRAQALAPVRTGHLKAGIKVEGHGLEATVSSTVRYAGYVEYGTSVMAPEPYMRPAAEGAEAPLADDLGDAGESIL